MAQSIDRCKVSNLHRIAVPLRPQCCPRSHWQPITITTAARLSCFVGISLGEASMNQHAACAFRHPAAGR